MNRAEFETYLNCFNSRDYEKAVSYFTDDVVLTFAGYTLSGKEAFLRFYQFFHSYINEKVFIRQFAGDDENVIIDAAVRLEGKKALTTAVLKKNGYERLAEVSRGDVVEIPQFIHYRIENGKFREIRCLIKE